MQHLYLFCASAFWREVGIEVESGDTLWDIASEYAETDNQETIRSYVGEIMKINGMAADSIQAGEYLTVVYYAD